MGRRTCRTSVASVSALLLLTGCAALGSTGPAAGGPESAARPAAGAPAGDTAVADDRAYDAEGAERSSDGAVRSEVDSRRELRRLLGPDPLGLARVPPREVRYEIPLEKNQAVEWWIGRFSGDLHDRFATYLRRAGRFAPMIRSRLREAGLPEDLVYKAMVESGMNTSAYSRARAVGLWQFMAGTARRYGLEVSYWVDERRDPVASTDAAIAYLSDLYAEFGGWYLAAAAYNAGEGRVRWGISRTGARDYWELVDRRALPRETRQHVPKIIAAALIGRSPGAYGFGQLERAEPLRYDVVTVPDATSLDVIAEAAGTTEERIRRLNPHFRRHVTPPGRQVQVRVPPGREERFRTRYARIPDDERVTWLTHRVTRGQTLSDIAARYGTSVRSIREANDGVRPRSLQIGQQLVVPRTGRPASGQVDRPSSGPVTVVVRRGDTLWDIARRHRVSTRQLKSWNDLRSSVIRPGDRLTVRR